MENSRREIGSDAVGVSIPLDVMLHCVWLECEYELDYAKMSRWLLKRHAIKISYVGLNKKLTKFKHEYKLQ